MSYRHNRETGGTFRVPTPHEIAIMSNVERDELYQRTCRKCGKVFETYGEADIHENTAHNSPYVEPVVVTCAGCGAETTPAFSACGYCGSFEKVTPSIQARKAKRPSSSRTPLFKCQECGHKFYSTISAERASYGESGCPGCGGSDIDAYYGK